MPLSRKDKRMEGAFEKRYGKKKGKSVYYATLNKAVNRGKPVNSPEGRRVATKRKHKKSSSRKRKR